MRDTTSPDTTTSSAPDTDSDGSPAGAGERYRVFHQKGRWQGLPLRVEDSDDAPAFALISPEDAPADAPAVLMFGVPNHGMMAGQPTNVFLVGYVERPERSLTLVDTGDHGAWDDLCAAIAGTGIALERIGRIVLTHCHPDHLGNAAELQRLTGAPVHAHRADEPLIERFGEGVTITDWVADDAPIAGDGFTLETIFTPGHAAGHYCVVEPSSRVLIAGDMISGFGSVGVFPPHGSMRAYIESLRVLLAAHERAPFSVVAPGHGPVIPDPRAKIEEYIVHRLQREDEVLGAIRDGATTMATLLPVIYPDVQAHLSYAARSTLQAHLDKLVEDGQIARDGDAFVAAGGPGGVE